MAVQALTEYSTHPQSTLPAHPQESLAGRQHQQLAKFLGWFSVALGVAEVVAPRQVARAIGTCDVGVLPLFGVREIVSGIGILSQRRPATWLWGRVAGDLMDLAYLAAQQLSGRAEPARLAAATAAVAGVTLVDIICAEQASRLPHARPEDTSDGSIHLRKSITINSTPEQLYQAWRKFEDFPRFMRHLKEVTVSDDGRSHWVAHAPAGMTVSWDAEITSDEPNRCIAWQSLPGASVTNYGEVRFATAPGDRGTQLEVHLHYRPTGGVLGASIANLFGESPEFQVQEDLRHFKQLIETGEITTTEGQPSGRGRSWIPGL